MARSLFAAGLTPLAVLLGACHSGPEVCIAQDSGYQRSAACAKQVCVAEEPPLVLTNDFAPDLTLTCHGCEQDAPASYQLTGSGTEVSSLTPEGQLKHNEITLNLSASWDRTFTPASLNAALAQDSEILLNNREHDTNGNLLRLSLYAVGAGDVTAASLANGRVRLTLKAHFWEAFTPLPLGDACYPNPQCSCGWSDHLASSNPAYRTIQVDLPYAEYQPPPAPSP